MEQSLVNIYFLVLNWVSYQIACSLVILRMIHQSLKFQQQLHTVLLNTQGVFFLCCNTKHISDIVWLWLFFATCDIDFLLFFHLIQSLKIKHRLAGSVHLYSNISSTL